MGGHQKKVNLYRDDHILDGGFIYIFQMGWNHQLVFVWWLRYMVVSAVFFPSKSAPKSDEAEHYWVVFPRWLVSIKVQGFLSPPRKGALNSSNSSLVSDAFFLRFPVNRLNECHRIKSRIYDGYLTPTEWGGEISTGIGTPWFSRRSKNVGLK